MTWQLDPSHSSLGFSTKHMLVASVRGQFDEFDVDADLNPEEPTRSHALVRARTASINTRDDRRDDHLRSPDFFDAEQFPELTFETKRIEPARGGEYQIVGDLTIRGVTREVVLEADAAGPVADPFGNQKFVISAEGKLNRKDWGLNWNAALEAGGFVVSDTVKLNVDLEFAQAA